MSIKTVKRGLSPRCLFPSLNLVVSRTLGKKSFVFVPCPTKIPRSPFAWKYYVSLPRTYSLKIFLDSFVFTRQGFRQKQKVRKELYISAKELNISAKETYICAKEPYKFTSGKSTSGAASNEGSQPPFAAPFLRTISKIPMETNLGLVTTGLQK